MEKTIETRVIDTLKPHPRNAALYGKEVGLYDQKLVDSLKAGIWPGEIQITTGNVIISGHRRCDHAIFAGIEEAEVWVRTDLPEDPLSPEVLEALLQGNLQRNKTREQQLREFDLWLEVEKTLAKERLWANDKQSGQSDQTAARGNARDHAAKRVGFNCGSREEKALKALKAADAAEATGNAEQAQKARLVKQELNKSLAGAVRVARAEGLLPQPTPKAKPTAPLDSEPSQVRETQPPPAPVSSDHRKIHSTQSKWVKERWVPAAQSLMEALRLLKMESTRLGNSWRHREDGGKIFTIPYQRLAKEWEEKGHLAELAGILGTEDQSLDGVLLQFEHVAKSCAAFADGMRVFTGCRKDNNTHD